MKEPCSQICRSD